MYSLEAIQTTKRAVVQNSIDLIEDAFHLHRAGRYARAVVLAILALEESSKVALLSNVEQTLRNGGTVDWKRFNARFTTHSSKLDIAGVVVDAYFRVIKGVPAEQASINTAVLKDLNKIKLSAIYVAVHSGEPTCPHAQVRKDYSLQLLTGCNAI